MNVGLAVAGIISVALGCGHETIGQRWILPKVTARHLPGTPFGSPTTSESMVRVTWHIVTLFAVASGGLLLTLAWAAEADPRVAVLRWFAGMWLAATAMAFYVARPRLRTLSRLPVPLLWVVVAVLCWWAST